MKRVLRISAYRRLLAAYSLNELTWSIGTIALAVLVYRRTGSSLGSAAFFLFSQALPAVCSPAMVAPLTGRSPRRLLPVLYIAQGAMFAVLAWLASHFSLVPMLLLTLVNGTFATTARAMARAASVELLQPLDLLHEGNAVVNLAFSVCFMTGPIIGGLVVVGGGTAAALLVNCVLFTMIAVLLATAHGLPPANPEENAEGEGGWARLKAGLAHARTDRPVRVLLLLGAVGMVAYTISIPVEVVFATHTLHAGAGGYGAMLSGWGAGAVVGSIVYARWRRRPGRILMVGTGLAMTFSFAVTAAAPTIVVAVIGASIGGAGNGLGLTAARTLLQEYTARRWMTLVMSMHEAIGEAAPGLGFLLGGAIAALAGPRAAFGVASAGSAVVTVAVWFMLAPRRMPPPPRPASTERPLEPSLSEAVPTAVPGHETLV